MTWIRLATHWVVSDRDLEKVSVYTSRRDCVGLHMHVVGCVCVSKRNSYKRGRM